MTEEELIKGCIREDKTYQKELFQRYAGKLLSVSKRYARNHQEAEDILQDALIKIFDNISKFKGEGSFEGWMRRITVNTALKIFQKSSFKKEKSGLEDYQAGSIEPSVYSKLNEETLMHQISLLPAGYKVVFNLYVIEGYSHKEIAERLEIGESTSRSQLVKARKMLQKQITELQKITTTG